MRIPTHIPMGFKLCILAIPTQTHVMRDLLFSNVLIIDRASPWNSDRVDIHIQGNAIERIGQKLDGISDDVLQIDGTNLVCTPGWIDIGVQVCDPGLEHREDLSTVTRAAAKAGFTAIGCLPNTKPALHSKAELLYLRNSSTHLPVDCLPVGAVSKHCSGTDITEMYDLHNAGAVAFSNGSEPIADAGLMLRALQYVKAFDSLVMNAPLDRTIAPEGLVHEGFVSTRMGVKGIPSLAESMMVERDLRLAEYTNSQLHISNISSARSVEAIRAAKNRGIQVTASVPILNLAFCHEEVSGFDAAWKVMPPLRDPTDRDALVEGLLDGTIDAISANHVPWDDESKKKEFPNAEFGVSGLDTFYGLYQTKLADKIDLETFVDAMSHGPRRIFRLPQYRVDIKQPATLTMIQPSVQWECTHHSFSSKSSNSPLIGQILNGQVAGIVQKGEWIPAQEA